MSGFLLIDKPAGMTSHDVVDRVRRLTGERRVGHAGTLDPFATGLLIVGVGRAATREMQKLVGLDKSYEAVFVLGARSDTDDRTGRIENEPIGNLPQPLLGKEGGLEKTLRRFTGEIEQVPPTYSAIKIGGKKMYEEARRGRPMEAKARRVTIYSIEQLDCLPPTPLYPPSGRGEILAISLRIHCSSGTYIRALARDIGEALGGGGYVEELRRTAIGPFSIDEAIPLPAQAPQAKACLACRQAGDYHNTLIPIPTFLSRL